MIAVPCTAAYASARVYRDSTARDIAYVDLLEPAPVHGGRPARWFPMPGETAYLAGEVRFGPGPDGFGDVARSLPNRRLMPMPWNISTVYVWRRDGDQCQVLAQGKTSGFGASNAIFNGTAPLGAMISPVRISAELSCPAEITVRVRGGGAADAPAAPAGHAPQEPWDATLGDILIAHFRRLLDQGKLTVSIQGDRLAGHVRDDLLMQVMLEWAHRFRPQVEAPVTLAYPAGALGNVRWSLAGDMEINWSPADRITLRVVRILRCATLE